MDAALGVLFTTLFGLAVLAIVLALRPAPPREDGPPSVSSRLSTSLKRAFPRRQLFLLLGGVAGGVLMYGITGLIIMIAVVPAAAIGLPALLAKPASEKKIERLEAIEAWTRALAGLIGASVGIEQAIKVSLANAPEPIRREIGNLVSRLNARMSPADALYAFADEMDDSTADVVVAHLVLSTKMRGDGLAIALQDLSDTVTSEVRHRLEIESDQEKPRSTARNVTLITVVTLTVMALSGTFLSGYQSLIGQLILTLYVGLYTLALVWMRRMTVGKPTPRLLVNVEGGVS